METTAGSSQSKRPGAILFMCGMNAIRSPMAEAIAKRLLPPDIYVRSAGVKAGEADPFVDVVLEEIGLSLPKHPPQTLDELEDDYFDIIVTLSPEAHHRALEATRAQAIDVEYWQTADPTLETGTRERILDAYRGVRDELLKRIEARFALPLLQGRQTI
ncbi:arsenate reductase [Rhizobium sp. Root149]|uniref:Protein-tyrosine-phosphatase n=1 Tax=Rhizobium rhizoryzae TaxID=451876 RepID=A0A7W6PS33_9HYPH|nr:MULTISPECIES: low molecular weight phosphatase family protein [Rhizobium]KQZ50742.1 arsenate reductase [Rhizobium sp. Root149]MBB4143340.1 protein-tyrosine-phosphatase [Rhizobium rhizoryzae]